MVTRVGINGFGRIGRQVTRAIIERHPDKIQVVAVNDLADTTTLAHLFKYDTNYGAYPGTVEAAEDGFDFSQGRWVVPPHGCTGLRGEHNNVTPQANEASLSSWVYGAVWVGCQHMYSLLYR